MGEMFNKFIGLKLNIQVLASFFQNDFEGSYPRHTIEDFSNLMDGFIEITNNLKTEGIEFLKNKNKGW